MMKKFYVLLPLFLFGFGFSQSIDLAKIKKEVTDSTSVYYMEGLMVKFRAAPASIDSIDARYLYYGSLFSAEKTDSARLDSFFAKAEIQKLFYRKKYEEAREKGLKILAQNPLDMETIAVMGKISEELQDINSAQYYLRQFFILGKTVLGSGDGKTKETAVAVVSIPDEYVVLALMKLNPQTMRRTSEPAANGMYDIWKKPLKKGKIHFLVLYDRE